MKIRSLSLVLALAFVAGGAMAGEAIHAATGNTAAIPANPAHQALGLTSADTLTDVDVARLARAAVDMPACSTCH